MGGATGIRCEIDGYPLGIGAVGINGMFGWYNSCGGDGGYDSWGGRGWCERALAFGGRGGRCIRGA